MEPGMKVEVRSKFERSWARGFEIAEIVLEPDDPALEPDDPALDGPAYRIRRRSDGQILPVLFSEEDLREERRGRGMWWY